MGLRYMSIKAKLLAGIAIAIVLMAGLLVANFYSLSLGRDSLVRIYAHLVASEADLQVIDTEIKEVRFRMTSYLIGQTPRVGNRRQLAEARSRIAKSWEHYKKVMSHHAVMHQSKDQRDNYLVYIGLFDNGLAQAEVFFNELDNAYAQGDKQRILPLLEDEWPFKVHVALLRPIEKLMPLQRKEVKQTYLMLDRTWDRLLLLEGLISIVGVILFVIVGLSLLKRILSSLGSAVHTAARIADGDMSVAIDVSAKDEIGELARAMDYMRNEVQRRQSRLAAILDNAAEGIVTFGEDGAIGSFNEAAQALFGIPEEKALGMPFTDLLYTSDQYELQGSRLKTFLRNEVQRCVDREGEVLGRHSDGAKFFMSLRISQMRLDESMLYTALISDITERRDMMDDLRTMAEKDGLTGLYNRRYFMKSLDTAIGRLQRSHGNSALLYVDLDNFKYVNDTMGHAAGDQLLVEVSEIFRTRARQADVVSRIGGDEFAIYLHDAGVDYIMGLAESYRERLSDYEFLYEGKMAEISCSIGVVVIDRDTESAEKVLSQADLACYLAKLAGRNRVHRYIDRDETNVSAMEVDMGWVGRIKLALESNSFVLMLQPIVQTSNQEAKRFEVLLRMVDDFGELVMPEAFFPAADRFGLSAQIDRWVCRNAIAILAEKRKTVPATCFSINLSAQSITDLSLCDVIETSLKEARLEPAALTFEVTESVAIRDMASTMALFSRLRAIGCHTSLDNFGTGLASFTYVRSLPVDEVKISGRFVKNASANAEDLAMVRAMTDIAHALGKTTTSEMVEDEEIYNLMVASGVDYSQGYYLGRPEQVVMPARDTA
jgi:diguanylate cyclase (GGDEF)-like protein/PAS domain S-box-containing protein